MPFQNFGTPLRMFLDRRTPSVSCQNKDVSVSVSLLVCLLFSTVRRLIFLQITRILVRPVIYVPEQKYILGFRSTLQFYKNFVNWEGNGLEMDRKESRVDKGKESLKEGGLLEIVEHDG